MSDGRVKGSEIIGRRKGGRRKGVSEGNWEGIEGRKGEGRMRKGRTVDKIEGRDG